jgi:hypothetical protein
MGHERIYRAKTAAGLAAKAVNGPFEEGTINELAFSEDPDEVVAVVDATGPVAPLTGKQVVRITVLPHHDQAQDLAERIWRKLGWDDIEGNDWTDPEELDVRAKGWDVRTKFFYS